MVRSYRVAYVLEISFCRNLLKEDIKCMLIDRYLYPQLNGYWGIFLNYNGSICIMVVHVLKMQIILK